MKEIELKEDIKLLLVKAKSFPDGVVPAYQDLERAIGNPNGRHFFGISRGENGGGIIYWAGVLPINGEEDRLGLEKFTVKKGSYVAEKLTDWRGREHVIGEAFQKLLTDPRLDPQGYCVEDHHSNGDVTCMVKIRNQHAL